MRSRTRAARRPRPSRHSAGCGPELARADLVLALGGMGTTQAELEATLGALADRAPFPIVALPGDLEAVGALSAAIEAMRARGQIVIDGRLIQRIELPGVTVGAIAGAGAASRLVADDDGCAHQAADVAAMFAALTAHARAADRRQRRGPADPPGGGGLRRCSP